MRYTHSAPAGATARHRRRPVLLAAALAAVTFAACNNDHVDDDPEPSSATMLLAAGLEALEPEPGLLLDPSADLGRVALGTGLHPWPTRTYELTTPALEPFAFDVLSLSPGNAGFVKVAIAHVRDGNATPVTGVTSLAAAGVIVTGPGLYVEGANPNWMAASGDGFGRVSVRGAITQPQVFAIETSTVEGVRTAVVALGIGPRSVINTAGTSGNTHPDVVTDDVIYSSDAWSFGMPAVAVSGDRTSIVCYEGDRVDPTAFGRYELRMQHDATTGAVTGGGAQSVGLDAGNWRDHEIAALFNVLAAVHSTGQGVELRLSFDRGATFGQQVLLDGAAGALNGTTRLVQLGMAADYSLAVAWWRSAPGPYGASELVLAEGRPVRFDPTGSPLEYEFDPAVTIHSEPSHVVPLPMGVQWSGGGDLVVAYGFGVRTAVNWTAQMTTEFHVAVRPWQGTFTTYLVDSEVAVARDPSAALLGSGASLQIFYAYEVQDGIRLAHLVDGGARQLRVERLGSSGAYAPAVFAREQGGGVRVDLLFVDDTSAGFELRASRWQVWGGSPREDFRLSTATMTPSRLVDPTVPYGYRITQLGWFGYDAVRDGDDLVVALDEETYDAFGICGNAPIFGGGGGSNTLASPGSVPPNFSSAAPPPLAPGMTEPMPAVDPGHRHQLRLVRIR